MHAGRARAWLIALLAVLLVLATEQVIEHYARQTALELERNKVLDELSALRARLEGVVNSNLFLVHGLTAVIAAQPEIDQAGFSRIAHNLVDERHALRNIGAAPDMVISLMYPMAGNEAAIGLDYRNHPGQRAAALRARNTGKAVLAGPLQLQQGGVGIIVREPVFLEADRPGGERRFWGLISAVIDAENLYRQAGLRDPGLELRLAIRGTDGTGPRGPVFLGEAGLFNERPVTLAVTMPGGSWQMAAIPAQGWGWQQSGIELIRLMGLLAALMAGTMAYRLTRGSMALSASSARLRALLDTLPDLVWLKDPDGVFLACNPRVEQLYGVREADILGRTDHDFAPPELADHFRAKDLDAIAVGGPSINEEWLDFASDGHRELLETIKSPVYDKRGQLLGVLGIARDITGRKQAEDHIRRLNRLYGVLSGINEAIIRLREPQALFDEACRIAVQVGGFRMAWLGMVEPGNTEVRPMAHAGVVDHYLENLHISLGDDEHARGPTGCALHAGQHALCNDIASDPRMQPWRAAALGLGYRSSAAFPIRVGGQVRGAFNLYADRPGFFDAEELVLLDELALDLGYALEFMEADRAREALNRRMLDLLESMSDGFVSLDRSWCYQYVNHKAGEMLGRTPADVIGKHIWSEFPEGLGQPFQKAYEQAMQGGEMIRLEDYYEPWEQWFENRIYPTQDGISIFFTDITERKQQEEELKRLHNTLNALVEGSTDAIFVKDLDGRYTVANQALAGLLGRPVADILGAHDIDLFPAHLARCFRADDLRIMAARATETYEEPVITPNGTYRNLTTKGPLVIDGEVRGVFGISRDISERKQAEAALQESETRLRLFIEHAPAALAMFDREMRYLAVSRRWKADYQLQGDLVGLSHYEVFPEIGEDLKAIHRQTLAGEVLRGDQYRFLRADGRVQWGRWEARPWYAADGGIGGIVIFTEDITERVLAQDALRRQKDILDRTSRLAQVGGWEFEVATQKGSWTDETARIHDLEPSEHADVAQGLGFFHGEDRRVIERAVRNAIELGEPYDLELVLTSAKGSRKWVRTIGLPVLEDGRVVRVEGAIQDITARKQAEDQARQGDVVLGSIFQALPDLFFLMGPDGTILDYRARKSDDLYAPPEVFLGKRMQDVLPAEVSAVFVDKMAKLGRAGGLLTYEYDLEMPDGKRRFEARLTGLPDGNQVVAVVRDITDQHHDRIALAESENRYRQLFEQNPVPMLVYEKGSLRLLAVNEAFITHYGYSREEALALRLTDLYPEEERQPITDLAASLTGLAYAGEWHHLKKDGSQIIIEARSHDLRYEGRATRVAVITDITERKQAEQAVRDSEERLRLALAAASQGLYDLDLRTGEAQVSPEYALMLGYDPATFHETNAAWRERLHPDDQARVYQTYEDYIAGRIPEYRVEFRQRTQSGDWKWILSLGKVQSWDADGQPLRMLGTHTDINAIKQAEAALREQEEFFRLIAESMGDMVAVLDLDGRRLYNSPSYRNLFGSSMALQGTDSFAEIHPQDRERVHEVFMDTVRSGRGHRINFRFILPDGSVRDIESQGGVILDANGQVARVVVVSRDVTERKRMEDEIRLLNTELEQRVHLRTAELAAANKELETFTYSVSHDLKAPLRGIDGYSRLLLANYKDTLDAEGQLFLNNVCHGVQQMGGLIEDLLAYSRMERRALHGRSVNLAQEVGKVIAERQADITARGMLVEVSLAGLDALADVDGLAMVLRNLVDNALKFTRDSQPPRLTIRGNGQEKMTILEISDNGIGFDMQFHDRIFEIFQRLQRAEDYPGTGVGLAIVRKAMQRMGGRVWAESSPGRGATFFLELPR